MTTDDVIIWHNPRCSKSRAVLDRLTARGINPIVVRYLDTPPDAVKIAAVLGILGVGARALIRKGEPEYKALGLDDPAIDDSALIAAMAAHPKLIERPVVIHRHRAVIGRPTEAVDSLF